jgi:hypothetical protein
MTNSTEVDYAFQTFVERELQRTRSLAQADNRNATTAELEREQANLEKWYIAGKAAVAAVEPGLMDAAKVLYQQAFKHDDPSKLNAMFSIGKGHIVVPAWFAFYSQAKAVVSAYRAAIHQPPL